MIPLLGIASDRLRCFSKVGIVNEVFPRGPDIHLSPGHHVEGGMLAVILVERSATRWLRLYG